MVTLSNSCKSIVFALSLTLFGVNMALAMEQAPEAQSTFEQALQSLQKRSEDDFTIFLDNQNRYADENSTALYTNEEDAKIARQTTIRVFSTPVQQQLKADKKLTQALANFQRYWLLFVTKDEKSWQTAQNGLQEKYTDLVDALEDALHTVASTSRTTVPQTPAQPTFVRQDDKTAEASETGIMKTLTTYTSYYTGYTLLKNYLASQEASYDDNFLSPLDEDWYTACLTTRPKQDSFLTHLQEKLQELTTRLPQWMSERWNKSDE